MYSSFTIPGAMEQILVYTSSVDPDLRGSLIEGLSSEQIEYYTQNLNFQISRELEEIYKWHNGMDLQNRRGAQRSLLYYHHFLPLAEAVDTHLSWIEDGIGEELGLFPIFEYEGEFYAASCGSVKRDSQPIYSVYHDIQIAYDSLRTMLLSILECYETGAYQIVPGKKDLEIDEERVAEIKLRWNPCRRTELSLYDHP